VKGKNKRRKEDSGGCIDSRREHWIGEGKARRVVSRRVGGKEDL
jgi:hypothetical protein